MTEGALWGLAALLAILCLIVWVMIEGYAERVAADKGRHRRNRERQLEAFMQGKSVYLYEMADGSTVHDSVYV